MSRVNSTLLAPQLVLADMGIPSDRPVGPSFLSRTGVEAALAWVEAATTTGGIDPKTIDIIARRPPRRLPREIVQQAAQQASVAGLRQLAAQLDNPAQSAKIRQLADDIETLQKLAAKPVITTARLLEAVRDDIGLGDALDNLLDANRRTAERSAHSDDLRALISVAGLHPRPAGFPGWLANCLKEPAGETPGGVRLATVHKVKGLEWPHVIVYDATDGLMPHTLAEEPEEERRVFHVAITRCSESVTVICGEEPSPYRDEMSTPAPKTRTPDPATPTAPKARTSSNRRPTAPKTRTSTNRRPPAPASDGEQQTYPGTSWPAPAGRKSQDDGRNRSGSRRRRR